MFGFCGELWWFVVSFWFLEISFRFPGSFFWWNERNRRFFDCKNVDETWCVGCFLWQFGGSKTWLWKVSGGEAGFSTPPFTM